MSFLEAYAHGAGARACALLSPSLRQQVAADQRASTCAEGVTRVEVAGRRVRAVRVYATSAFVRLDTGTMFLGARGGTWRIDAFGCTSAGDRPSDCQEQS